MRDLTDLYHMSDDHARLKELLDMGYQIPVTVRGTIAIAQKYEDCYVLAGETVGSPRFGSWCSSTSLRFIDPDHVTTSHIKTIGK